MKSLLVTHSFWFLFTVGMFVAGSYFAARDSAPPPSSSNQHGQAVRLPSLSKLSSGGLEVNASSGSTKGANDQGSGGTANVPLQPEFAARKPVEAKDLPPLTERQIEELVVAALKSSNPVERRKNFDRLLQQMESDSFSVEQAMMMRSAMHEHGANGEQWRLFDYAWGANDPAAAVAHIDEIAEKHRAGFTSNMLPGLASVDPHTAVDLVSAMEGKMQQQMTGRLLEGLADYDAGFATDYVFELAESGNPNAANHMKRLAHEVLSTSGFNKGLRWAESLQAGPLQAAALVRVANEYANQDPQAAAKWSEQFVRAEQNSRMFGEVVREWGNVGQASEWVDSLEPSLAKLDALSAVYGFRGAQQPHEAVQQIMEMEPSPDRNFAINGFISGLAHQDGEAAVTWAAEITDPGMREAAMVRAGKQYFQQDSEAAIEWLAGSGLPERTWEKVTAVK